ncbi:MAG: hypothetical protein COA43_08585 [Robiginitomaculum sp.]|nr:MAG: hypothetical protein COA43_08585 [Robiginitomaculum sp.]
MSTNKNKGIRFGTIALMASIGLNGLLGGFVIANTAGPKTPDLHMDMPHKFRTSPNHQSSGKTKNKHVMRLRMAYDHPQALLAHLPPRRRREIMKVAMKNVSAQTTDKPHELLMQLRKSHKKTIIFLKKDTLDQEALTTILAQNRILKEKLARQGDTLIIEILKQLTPEERQGAAMSLNTAKRKRFKHKRKEEN